MNDSDHSYGAQKRVPGAVGTQCTDGKRVPKAVGTQCTHGRLIPLVLPVLIPTNQILLLSFAVLAKGSFQIFGNKLSI